MIEGDKFSACRLCGNVSSLCESHIVPEFFYDYQYTGNSRKAIEIRVPVEEEKAIQERIFQKGYREYLLCKSCEALICRYEAPFALFWKEQVLPKAPFALGQLLRFKVDYHLTKLLLLSIFWRSSISARFGQHMHLGPYSDKVRDILLKSRKPNQSQYPVLCVMNLQADGQPFTNITPPEPAKVEAKNAYTMHFGGCKWHIVMSDNWIPRSLRPLEQVLSEDGTLHIYTQHFMQDKGISFIASQLRSRQ